MKCQLHCQIDKNEIINNKKGVNMKQYSKITLILLFILVKYVQSETTPSIPQLINYQGMLTNAEGQPLETKEYKLSFSIFKQPTGGEEVWGPQIFDGVYTAGHGAKVPVVRGHFNLILGPTDTEGRSITEAFQTKDAFLEVSIENNVPITPRQQILSSPYAISSLKSTYSTIAETAVIAKESEIADIAKYVKTVFGAWEEKNVDTIYQATTDGLVIANIYTETEAPRGFLIGYTDSNNPPTTFRCSASQHYYSPTDAHSPYDSFTMPVRKDHWWKVSKTFTSHTPTVKIFWISLGKIR